MFFEKKGFFVKGFAGSRVYKSMSTDVSLPRNDSSPSADVPVIATATNPAEPKLPDDPVVLKRMIEELLAALRSKDRELEQVRHRLDQLLRRLYGPKTEKWDPTQLLLFPEILAALRGEQPTEESAADVEPTAAATATEPARRKGHGRGRLSRELPRQRREYALSEAERCCPDCGHQREKFDEDVTEQLDLIPAKLFVIEHARFKYKCRHCQGKILTAPKPNGPIWRGLPGPGLCAQVIVSKYHDHLPLYRQESMFERYGLKISRQTQCTWAAQFAKVLRPIVDLMKHDVLQSTVIGTDDTRALVQDKQRGKRIGSLWLYAGDRNHPGMVFDYTPTRSSEGPKEFLGAFAGFLQADSHRPRCLLPRPRRPHDRGRLQRACPPQVPRGAHERGRRVGSGVGLLCPTLRGGTPGPEGERGTRRQRFGGRRHSLAIAAGPIQADHDCR